MRIALMRSGTVLFGNNNDASPVAGNQDALGVLRYLKQSGHDVCVFGQAEGDLGVPTFRTDFSGLSIKADPAGGPCVRPAAEEYDFRINFPLTELRHWAPEVCVNVAGQQPSHSNPGNPWGCKPLYTAISTNYPMLKACQELRLRRIVILNDPRNLPREHENHYWPYTLPAAVLSQRSRVNVWETRGRRMRREEVYAACENWWTYGMPLVPLGGDRRGVVVVAHSHAHDLRVRGPERAKAWNTVLATCGSPYDIYGQGWDGTLVLPGIYKGVVPQGQVSELLTHYACGPMIALEKGFATGKLREYVVAGCLPRPVTGGLFTYDSDERYLPLNHPARIQLGQRWGEIYDRGFVEELREKSTPNFDPLEQALVSKGEWGGYRWQ